MRRTQSVKLLVVFLGAAAITVTSAYFLLRDSEPAQQTDQVAASEPNDDSLEESLKRKFVGKPTSELLRHFKIRFDALQLHDEPPDVLNSASFFVRNKDMVVQVRVVFAVETDGPSTNLLVNEWTSEFVGSLKIGDFEIKPADRQ